jgi:tRNA dimethylallyltransferase
LKRVIIIAGPTAAGKTTAAIRLAQHLGTEIISADSRQCYKELNIGVARPSPEELSAVSHHFIASHSIHQKVTAITFESYALDKLSELFVKHDTVVMVGGTGLYIRAFCEGMDEIPEVPETIHQQVIGDYQKNGLEWLQRKVAEADPLFYQTGENQNPHRLTRALEVITATGRSILDFRKGEKAKRDFQIEKYALTLPKEDLHRNIHHRVDRMMEQGLLEEARSLFPHRHLNALQTVGYKELFEHFDGKTTLGQAIEEIKKNTRHYAKRQMTWFRKDAEYRWMLPGEVAGLAASD